MNTPHVDTEAICAAVKGRELDILLALGISWNGNSTHIRCPYPDHDDKHPSWRWDSTKRRAHCTCKPSASILDVVSMIKDVDFPAAKVWVAEVLGRPDLVANPNGRNWQHSDATSLLSPLPENRDDTIVWNYLAHRLGIEPDRVPHPTTEAVGIKSLAYFDPPLRGGGKPVRVGDFPAAIFETVDRDGKRHAHRIYLAQRGIGKADLGIAPDGAPRDVKKSAKKIQGDHTVGRAVIWGTPSTAETELIFEGIETAAAAAVAFAVEIGSGKMIVAACITAGGIKAFKPWPSARRVIIGADRDEGSRNGRRPTRCGETAAQKFAAVHHSEVTVSIALPGTPGEKVDWLDILRRDGAQAVRDGILGAELWAPSHEHGKQKQRPGHCHVDGQ
jgi:Toprim domain